MDAAATCSWQPMGRALGAATKAARVAAGWELARAWRLGPCARGAAETGAMLRVRCLRGGSRGAEAVHYIGSRVSAYAASGPLRDAGWGPRGRLDTPVTGWRGL